MGVCISVVKLNKTQITSGCQNMDSSKCLARLRFLKISGGHAQWALPIAHSRSYVCVTHVSMCLYVRASVSLCASLSVVCVRVSVPVYYVCLCQYSVCAGWLWAEVKRLLQKQLNTTNRGHFTTGYNSAADYTTLHYTTLQTTLHLTTDYNCAADTWGQQYSLFSNLWPFHQLPLFRPIIHDDITCPEYKISTIDAQNHQKSVPDPLKHYHLQNIVYNSLEISQHAVSRTYSMLTWRWKPLSWKRNHSREYLMEMA